MTSPRLALQHASWQEEAQALVAARDPIDLAELNQTAELMVRKDRKYLLPLTQVPRLLEALPGGTRVLCIDDLRHFGYQSHYFDTPALDCFLASAHARRRRYKVRIRTYLDSGLTYLEVKTEGARGVTVKERQEHPTELQLDPRPGAQFISQALSTAGMPDPAGPLLHTLTCCCSRVTFVLPDAGARLTLDTSLSWSVAGGGTLGARHLAVVETKTAGTASAADRALWGLGTRPCRFSKYGTALAAADRRLPANRWHRSMAAVFGDQLEAPADQQAA